MKFELPELGENIEEATVLKVLVAEGDTVAAEQGLIEVESEKANLEVPSPVAGTIGKVHVKEGQKIKVGQAIVTIDESAAKSSKPAAKPQEPKVEPQKKEEAAEDTKQAQPPAKARESETKEPATTEARSGRVPVFAAPSVRQFAREIGVSISDVAGSGPEGRISIDDIKRAARDHGNGGTVAGRSRVDAGPLPDFSQWGEIEREDMNGVRKKTASHMTLAWSAIPHVTLFEKADVTEMEAQRQRYKHRAEEAGGKLTITAMLLKVTGAALMAHPKLRASVDMQKQQVVHKNYCHVGLAVDTPRGLVVPVIRDVNRKSIITLAKELNDVAERARDGKLTLEDMAGGVFTVTNLGGLHTDFFTPIVNHPQVAILGVGRSRMEPVYDDKTRGFQPRLMMPLSLSIDHRLVDGADGARFLHWIVEAIENPLLMAMEG